LVDTPVSAAKAKKHRSPTYPGINLQQAIKRATEFYDKEHRSPASFKAAVSHWGYSEKSSGALVTAAALKSFGLLNEIEVGSGRTFQVSPLGLKIVADKRPESSERDAAIRDAALKPKIHAELWRKYNGRLPSDAELQYRLENDLHFNANVIGAFIKELRDTISFAKLSESDKVGEAREEETGPLEVKTGDYVQWVSQGADQFQALKKVIGFSDDARYAFIEGEKTGVPVAELEVGDAPILPDPPLAPPPAAPRNTRFKECGKSMRNEVFSLDDGGEVVITWPSPLPADVITDIKDWLKIVERKIARSSETPKGAEAD
jgi:hypothetical protein